MNTATTTSAASSITRRFVAPEDLICPGCGDQVIGIAPAYWQVSDGLPAAQFSHPDRSALCRTRTGRIAEPVEVTR
jgi:hypothetical protein